MKWIVMLALCAACGGGSEESEKGEEKDPPICDANSETPKTTPAWGDDETNSDLGRRTCGDCWFAAGQECGLADGEPCRAEQVAFEACDATVECYSFSCLEEACPDEYAARTACLRTCPPILEACY